MAFPLRTRTRGRPGRNAGVVNVAAAPSFNPLTDFSTGPVHGVWAGDPLWVPPADGGAVSSWRNGGSVGTPDFTQGTGSKQPTYRASTAAFNNQPTVQFDGTDDIVKAAVTSIPQPFWIVTIGSYTEGDDYITGWSGSADHGMGRSAGKWQLHSGALKQVTGALSAGTPYMLVGYLNGASSTLRVNATTSTASNAGTTAFGVFAVGSHESNAAYSLNGHVAYVAVFTTDPTGQAEWASFTSWVLTTYGITVAP